MFPGPLRSMYMHGLARYDVSDARAGMIALMWLKFVIDVIFFVDHEHTVVCLARSCRWSC